MLTAMLPSFRQLLALLATLSIAAVTTEPVRADPADDHVVALSDLHRDLGAAASERTKNLADIARTLSLPATQAQLSKANVRSDQLKTAISRLDDKELARLADRARAANDDVEAGVPFEAWFLAGLAVVILLIVVCTQNL
jgi:hypothetical protein